MEDSGGNFPSTAWSLVLSAGRGSAHSKEALASLCTSYWRPVYCFVRHRGYPIPEAEDLTQGFFTRLLETNWLADADRNRGRFRSFLLGAVVHYLSNERDRERAQKRGGGRLPLPLDFVSAEAKLSREPADHQTPERLFEREWAHSLLDHVMAMLRDESSANGRKELFEHLQPYLTDDSFRGFCAQTALELNMTEGAVKVALHRLRQRYGELIREEILHTVASPAEVDQEILYLLAALDPV
jgi:DNA-directed RNA polymerase specialized sigma24 family protein